MWEYHFALFFFSDKAQFYSFKISTSPRNEEVLAAIAITSYSALFCSILLCKTLPLSWSSPSRSVVWGAPAVAIFPSHSVVRGAPAVPIFPSHSVVRGTPAVVNNKAPTGLAVGRRSSYRTIDVATVAVHGHAVGALLLKLVVLCGIPTARNWAMVKLP